MTDVKAGPIARAVSNAIKGGECHHPAILCANGLSDHDANMAAIEHWNRFGPHDWVAASRRWYEDAKT